MKYILVLLMAMLTVLTSVTFASVPPLISYQGKLMQPNGILVPDGTYNVRFAIYDAPVNGNTLWSETNTAIQVKSGLFSTMLGSVINLPANIFDSPSRFFGVKVGDDPEMTPRQQIASVAFAMKAASADIATTVPDAAITTLKVAPGAITADRLAPGVAIPPGTILMWSGAVSQIPQGWALCDGANATPNLRDRFIVGAGAEYSVGSIGGEKTHQLTVAEMPNHNHSVYVPPYFPHQRNDGAGIFAPDLFQGYGWDELSSAVGNDQPHENRPPYYAICFIMKMGY